MWRSGAAGSKLRHGSRGQPSTVKRVHPASAAKLSPACFGYKFAAQRNQIFNYAGLIEQHDNKETVFFLKTALLAGATRRRLDERTKIAVAPRRCVPIPRWRLGLKRVRVRGETLLNGSVSTSRVSGKELPPDKNDADSRNTLYRNSLRPGKPITLLFVVHAAIGEYKKVTTHVSASSSCGCSTQTRRRYSPSSPKHSPRFTPRLRPLTAHLGRFWAELRGGGYTCRQKKNEKHVGDANVYTARKKDSI